MLFYEFGWKNRCYKLRTHAFEEIFFQFWETEKSGIFSSVAAPIQIKFARLKI